MVCVMPFRGWFGGVYTLVGSTYVWEWTPRGLGLGLGRQLGIHDWDLVLESVVYIAFAFWKWHLQNRDLARILKLPVLWKKLPVYNHDNFW